MSLGIDKQALNEVKVEGLISEIKLRKGTTPSVGEYMAGDIVIEVEQELNGIVETNLIPVSVFAAVKKKDGNPNVAYTKLEEIEQTYNSIASSSREAATRVRFNQGSIEENSYFTPDKELRTSSRIKNTFFNKVSADFNPHAIFTAKIVILRIKDEVDKEGVETGRLLVQGAVVQWGEKVDVVDFIVESKEAIAYISQNYEKNQTVQVSGKVRFTVTTKTKRIEQGFGEPIEEVKTFYKRELVITSGSSEAFDEDESYNVEAIAKGLEARRARLEATASKSANKPKAVKTVSKEDVGF